MDFSQYKTFQDYCSKTDQEPDFAIKNIIEKIDFLSDEIKKLK